MVWEERRGANPGLDQAISKTQDWEAKEFIRLDSRASCVSLDFFVGVSSLLEVSCNKTSGLKCVCKNYIPFRYYIYSFILYQYIVYII